MLKVIFFDAVGTLIHLPRPVGEHYREVARRFGLETDAVELERAFRAAWAAAPGRPSDGRARPDDDKGWWRELVSQVLTQVLTRGQMSSLDFDGYFEAVYAHFAAPGVWAVYPEVLEVLEDLRAKGFRLAVISNFDRRLYRVLGNLSVHKFFECVVVSSEVGADKPDPLIFERALAAMQVLPGEAMHVGDDPGRDGGAAAVGLRVFHLQRPAGTLRDLPAGV